MKKYLHIENTTFMTVSHLSKISNMQDMDSVTDCLRDASPIWVRVENSRIYPMWKHRGAVCTLEINQKADLYLLYTDHLDVSEKLIADLAMQGFEPEDVDSESDTKAYLRLKNGEGKSVFCVIKRKNGKSRFYFYFKGLREGVYFDSLSIPDLGEE